MTYLGQSYFGPGLLWPVLLRPGLLRPKGFSVLLRPVLLRPGLVLWCVSSMCRIARRASNRSLAAARESDPRLLALSLQ